MQKYRRTLTPGGTYFFTVNTYQRQLVLTQPVFYDAIKESIREVKANHAFKIDAFVLLPDHIYCIWTLPEGDSAYSFRWSMIKRLVSQKMRASIKPTLSNSRLKRQELGLWQRRFWEHQIRDERDFEMHVNYIHWNPVKHAYVRIARDWPYSSFHKYVRENIYPEDWGGWIEPERVCFGERG